MRKSEVKKLRSLALTKDSCIHQRLLHLAINLTTFKLQSQDKETTAETQEDNWTAIQGNEHSTNAVYKYNPPVRGKLFNYKKRL